MDYKSIILRKLFTRRVIGGKHTAAEHALKGVPKHEVGNMKTAMEELIKEGLLIPKQTHYGLQVSLNPDRLEEIKKIIKEEAS